MDQNLDMANVEEEEDMNREDDNDIELSQNPTAAGGTVTGART